MSSLADSRRACSLLLAATILASSGLAAAQTAPVASAPAGVPVAPTVPGPRIQTATQGEVVSVVEVPATATMEWYGATPLIVDGVAATAITLLAATSSSASSSGPRTGAWLLSIGAYLSIGTISHASHPSPLSTTRLAAGLAMRVGMPLVGASFGCLAGARRDDEGHVPSCGSPGAVIAGLAAGAIGAALIDDLALSWRTVPPAAPSALRLTPSLVVGKQGTLIGLNGAW